MILKYVEHSDETIPIAALFYDYMLVEIMANSKLKNKVAYTIEIRREELVNLQEYYPKDKIERVLRRSIPEIRRLWCTQPANLILTD